MPMRIQRDAKITTKARGSAFFDAAPHELSNTLVRLRE
jgi:hypothetical protein